MQLTHLERQGIAILEPIGRSTIGQGDLLLRNGVQRALETGALKILVDLAAIRAIDSSGIAELVAARSAVQSRGGSLKLMHVPKKVEAILAVTRLIEIFDVYHSRAEAVDSYGVTG